MFGQTVVISYEDGITTTLDVSPSNEELSGILQSIDCVFRTYHFLGGVPPAYEHLMTDDAERGDEGAIVSKYFTFDQWHALIATESFEQPLATAAAR